MNRKHYRKICYNTSCCVMYPFSLREIHQPLAWKTVQIQGYPNEYLTYPLPLWNSNVKQINTPLLRGMASHLCDFCSIFPPMVTVSP